MVFSVKKKIISMNLGTYCNLENNISKHTLASNMEKLIMHQFTPNWLNLINSTDGASGRGHNKLRTYCTFITEFSTDNHCRLILPLQHRAALNKFRCGVAPIRIEIGRYEN